MIDDGTGVYYAGVPFGSNPLEIDFTLLTADTYRLAIKSAAGVTLTNFDNLPLAGSGTVDSVSMFALQTDGDQVFNSMTIESASLTPPDILNLQPANNSIYVATPSQLSFDVSSAFSTVSSNGISLVLNGVSQNSFTFTGSGTTNLHVVLNPALQNNVLYTGTIVATDAFGNHATNSFSFDTWSSLDPFIESEDYNATGGHWIDNFQFLQPNQAYQGLLGSNGVDYLEYDLSGTNPISAYGQATCRKLKCPPTLITTASRSTVTRTTIWVTT